ncbi:ATP-binding cassette domain-containing protein [Bacillus lacus]|uniref:ATP-binding cassette domain-containing protein n=1 Tax=Metabacillus lacus TaxID=1983721 RepID=A0A7X2LXD8_9BACI|nr:ABC transporter ATP-binding protein [Metabacillus lacus]MRX72455.1 ATP-binding cassette domain-containing protein [Metabacillus lacus]
MLEEIRKPFRYKKPPIHTGKENAPEQKPGNKKVRNWSGTVMRVWRYLAGYRGLFTLVLLMVVISSALGLLGPYLVGRGIDRFIVSREPDGFFALLLLLAGVYLIYSISMLFQNFWMITIAQGTVSSMRKQLFRHFHRLPISYFDKRQHGELMSRVTNDIENVSSTLNSSVIQIVSSILTLIGTVAVMLYLSPLLTLITMTIIPVMYFGMKWITSRTGKLYKEQQKNLGSLNGYIQEMISGQKIVKTFSQEQKVADEFMKRGEKLRQAGFWAQTFSGFIPKLMNVLNNVSFALIAGVGGVMALNQMISIGTIVIFTEYARQFTRPLNDLANQFNTLLSAVAGAERVFEVLDEEEEESDEKSAAQLGEVQGKVSFQSVSFSYEKESKTVSGLSFTADPGETIALVGPTGAGKTTVINLLSRFYEPDSGSIYIDGTDISSVTRESLRRQMAFVLQDSFLFQGTIRENIRYGKLDADDAKVERAAKLANAHSFIKRLPGGYDTVLSQEGGGISQGQKQLLSIARAILADPKILIMDEATSSIDTITELKIQEAVRRLMEGRTSFVIAHRLNTIKQADQILVLENGVISERGSHSKLLKSKGFYHHLYYSQFQAVSRL